MVYESYDEGQVFLYCSDYRLKKKKKNENAEGCVRSCLASRSERIIATDFCLRGLLE